MFERLAPLARKRVWLIPLVFATLLTFIYAHEKLAFHTLAEFSAIVVCFVIFAISISTSHFTNNKFLCFLAAGYFWIGFLDLCHSMVYPGMNVFMEGSGLLSTQFWIVARFFEACLLFTATLMVGRNFKMPVLFVCFGVLALGAFGLVYTGSFPVTYVEGAGLTPFKVVAEYAIIAILAAAIFSLYQRSESFQAENIVLIAAAVVMTIVAELCFTLYVGVFDFMNFLGHVFKIFSFWLVFEAVVTTNLRRPYVELTQMVARAEADRKTAESANFAKSRFLALMSHEVRTPMNGVLGMLRLMGRMELGKQQRSYVDVARKSAESLLGILNDILDYSKIEAGQIDLDLVDFDPEAVIREVLSLNQSEIDGKDLSVEISCDADVPELIRSDETRYRQIISNLVSNAIKFTEEGLIDLRISLEENGQEGEIVLKTEVVDSGVGISQKDLANIFERFTQANTMITRQFGGTGLGLAISRQLARIMGGDVYVESEPGVGSRFWFTIKAARAYRKPLSPAEQSAAL